MSEITIEVHAREEKKKNASRRLRAEGQVPAVVYGGGRDSLPIRVGRRKVEDLMRQGGGENAVFLLQLAGTDKSRHAIIRDLQTDPITGQMIHIDFLRIAMDEELTVTVPIELHGTPLGVKNEDGILDFVTREVEVRCLPDKIPAHLELDVSGLHIGQHLEAGDLELPEGVSLEEEAQRVIVSIAHKQRQVVEEEEEAEELIEAETEEPEVIGREKEEEAEA